MSSHSTPSTHPAPPSPQLQPHLCSGQASDQGNTIYAIPYALRPIHGPPYPELTIVLIPNILREARTAPRPTTAPRRTTALRRTAPHRAAPHRTAPHRTAPPRRVECPYELLYRPGGRDPPLQLRPVLGRGRRNDGEFAPPPPPLAPTPHDPTPLRPTPCWLRERDGLATAMHYLSPAPVPRAPRATNRRGVETFRTRSWSPSGSPCG